MRASRLLRAAGAGLACTWVTLLLVAPSWAARAEPSAADGRRTTAALVWLAGARVCHQRPERSFHLHRQPLAVCGRCTGLYVAGAAGLLASVRSRRARVPASPHLPAWWPRRLDRRAAALAVAAAPTAITWGLEVVGVWQPGTALRAIAALPVGLTAGWLIGRALD